MVQPMLKGTELFIGAKYEDKFGHVVLCGLGCIFVEVLVRTHLRSCTVVLRGSYSMHSLVACL